MDQLSSNNTTSAADVRPIQLKFGREPAKLCGRVIVSGREAEDLRATVSLMVGTALLGTIRTSVDSSRADFDDDDAPEGRDFQITDYGLGAFARISGLENIRLAVDCAGDGSAEFPIATLPTDVTPLGSRTGFGKAVRLADVWLQSDREVALRFEASPQIAESLDAYQCVGSAPILVAADLSISGPATLAMTLVNRFAPLLLVFKGDDGAIDAIDLVPFPSLLRGGLHAAERLIVADRSDELGEAAALSTDLVKAWLERLDRPHQCVAAIEIKRSAQAGREPVLDPDLLEWIYRVLGIGVRFEASGDQSQVPAFIAEIVARYSAPEHGDGHTLHLPADCVPTISALVRSLPNDALSARISGGLGVVDWNRHGRVWSIWQPHFAGRFETLQPQSSHGLAPELTMRADEEAGNSAEIALSWPLALAYRDLPTRVARNDPFEFPADLDGPVLNYGAADLSPVNVIIVSSGDGRSAVPLLESLVRQDGPPFGQILACLTGPDGEDVVDTLEELFPGRNGIVRLPASLGRLAQVVIARDALEGEGRVIVVDAATVIPDPRTLSTLLTMLEFDGIASAGCLLRQATEKMKPVCAGYSFGGLDLRSVPTASFAPIDPDILRGPATYPVVASSLSLVAIRSDVLFGLSAAGSSLAGCESDDLLLGIQLLQQGWLNLCTTAVSAYTGAAAARSTRDYFSIPYRHSAADLAKIADSTLIAQRLA